MTRKALTRIRMSHRQSPKCQAIQMRRAWSTKRDLGRRDSRLTRRLQSCHPANAPKVLPHSPTPRWNPNVGNSIEAPKFRRRQTTRMGRHTCGSHPSAPPFRPATEEFLHSLDPRGLPRPFGRPWARLHYTEQGGPRPSQKPRTFTMAQKPNPLFPTVTLQRPTGRRANQKLTRRHRNNSHWNMRVLWKFQR